MQKRKILVTNALTYANDSIHLGHVVGYVLADIWVRFQKMSGHECYYVCGSDCHGTPVMLRAESLGITPEALVEKVRQEQIEDIKGFHVALDNYYTTHSDENKALSALIYERLKARGDITKKIIAQAFDPEKEIFLPDRYVKGECPRCGAQDQYGDSCESCGATYSPMELKNPVSVISNATPVTKESEHFFFDLPKYESALKTWVRGNHLQEQVANKLDEWFDHGLQNWDISRDAPYFGFEIPGEKDKYFYVWMDAPVGYIASFKNFCDQIGVDFSEYWDKANENKTELYHFLGKDIVYFHALFWPAMLMGADFRTPTAICTHGFLTINGQKMSKSRGTFIKARKYLEHLDPEYLRYYLATKLTGRVEDLDLNLEDFRLKVNADLVGKVINIGSRCSGFISKKFEGNLADHLDNDALWQAFVEKGDEIAKDYEARELSKALRSMMQLADRANAYIDEKKPWALAKEEGKMDEVQAICTMGLNLFRLLILYLKPVLPTLAIKVEEFLNVEPLVWDDYQHPLLHHKINTFKPLMQRIDEKEIEQLID